MTYQPPAAPPQQWQPAPQRSNTALVAVVSVLAVLVVVFMTFAAYLLLSKDGGQSTNTTETKVIAPPAADVKPAAPAPARQAPVQQARFSTYWAGSRNTSSAFAANVYSAYVSNYNNTGSLNASIRAYSPVTGGYYDMWCGYSGGTTTCTGGDNAVVYIS
ncbi:hypothetical protein FRC0493_00828 [Corynebacterium diphtheriae]|nr:hypothetical protein CIP107549_00822 [Corynebacterium diphtheriae]CAB0641799.1 hypothetical protein CIP107566_00851 [Corynebacterium diphtheriae]CAB0988459.1 hypothetical protein FRC0493_00828 [Corynebacterium diphtheriae]